MANGRGRSHTREISTDQQALVKALARVVAENVVPLADEIARLSTRLQRPDLQKYTVDEACIRLKRSRSSLYALFKSGELNRVNEQGRTYLTEEEIQRWERSQRN